MFCAQGRTAFETYNIIDGGTREERAGRVVFRMLQMRYDRSRFISLLTLLIYNSASRIQSTYRGHTARRMLAPRFRASCVAPPVAPQPTTIPPVSSVPTAAKQESDPDPPPPKKSSSPPRSPPPLAIDDMDEQLAAPPFPSHTMAPRGKEKLCSPVWLMQVLLMLMLMLMLMMMMMMVIADYNAVISFDVILCEYIPTGISLQHTGSLPPVPSALLPPVIEPCHSPTTVLACAVCAC
jgi:hypothetical protein